MGEHKKSGASAGSGHAGEHNGSDGTTGHLVQEFGGLRSRPLGLADALRRKSVELLNHVLADSLVLRDLYKKHHWQVNGPTAHQLHELFDDIYDEQVKLVDHLAERVQTLGGVSLAAPHDVIEESCIERPPRGIESARGQLVRLLAAHGVVIGCTRSCIEDVEQDQASQDLLVSEILAENEKHVWLLSSLLEDTAQPGARAGAAAPAPQPAASAKAGQAAGAKSHGGHHPAGGRS